MDRRLFKCKCTCGSMFDTFSELEQHVRKRRSKKHRLLVKREWKLNYTGRLAVLLFRANRVFAPAVK